MRPSDQVADETGVLDSIPKPVFAIDRGYRITRINKAAAQLLKLAPDDCVGKQCHELLNTKHCRTKECACAQAMEKRHDVTAETTYSNDSGTALRCTASPLTNQVGEVIGAVECLEDITEELNERKALNGALQALRGVPTPVMSITRDFTVLAMNDSGAQLVGLTPEECVGRKCFDLFRTGQCRTEQCACQQAMVRATAVTAETVARPGGREVPIRYTGAPLRDEQGRVFGAVEFVLDITQEVEKRTHNREVTEVLFQMKDKDLRSRVVGKYADDLERVSHAINGGLDAINEAMQDIASSVQQVAATSGEVSTASQRLAEGAQEQAAAVEQITAGLQQTDAQIKANAENAVIANQLVGATNSSATSGRDEMDRMLAAMSEISEASLSISRIMKVIDEIAFQTNILALNAAVEAARAGKYGRGFAVVAQEVRNLAGRSAKAAQETAELIEASNKKVTYGVAIAEKTARALDEIVLHVTKVKDLVAEISIASREQATNVSQVSSGMNQISSAVSAVSAQSEETAAAAEQLSGIAESLQNLITTFKLAEKKKLNVSQVALPPGVTPELLQQLLNVLQAQDHRALGGNGQVPQSRSVVLAAGGGSPTPAEILPLDMDSRGYGNF